ncbi:uncharacterized protein At5g19025-like [Punica granatum]|uniref:Ribosomal protein L34e superfamily protein n=2 Tax=Punica granatum TaxID=22663 RepID=A0A218WQ38_PUNGR|nr:uncharacterized protein At5g19025-like [Punica granatum]OWM74756.1 hypothetical protein CDL15_Pgr004523 [Punica granatum]PKI53873.1 hypothetical protein CRG98_025731 [Punica granatum]
MVYLHNSISVCKNPVDQFTLMGSSASSTDKSRTRKGAPASSCPRTMPCHGSRWAAIDVVILIAVVGACGFLLYPYAKFILVWLMGAVGTVAYVVKEEFCEEPLIYGCVGIGVSCSALATWGLVMCFTGRKCSNPRCRGLRKAAEFDIQLETEDCLKNSSSTKEWSRKGLFELPRDHHRELEAELKKMAPPNGRAVLLFKARCGCSVGRLVVPGPRRVRKIKK